MRTNINDYLNNYDTDGEPLETCELEHIKEFWPVAVEKLGLVYNLQEFIWTIIEHPDTGQEALVYKTHPDDEWVEWAPQGDSDD